MNIADILQDKPLGILLYSPMIGPCVYRGVLPNGLILIEDNINDKTYSLLPDGKFNIRGKMMLYPSEEMCNWAKFSWKKGTVLINRYSKKKCIFNGFSTKDYSMFNAKYIECEDGYFCDTHDINTLLFEEEKDKRKIDRYIDSIVSHYQKNIRWI